MILLRHLRRLAAAALLLGTGWAAEILPPAPAHYFNDYAGVVPAGTAQQLNARLDEFERATSCQVLVAVFPRMQSDSSLEDYTQRLAQSWRVGQKLKKNGCVLFVFIQDRRLRIEVGYGLEGALPDALAKRIIEDEIKPHFKGGDYAAGLTAGVDAILKATRGEYKGHGNTIADALFTWVSHAALQTIVIFIIGFVILIVLINASKGPRGTVYHSGGGTYWGSGGGGGGFSGGGFSGGGGSFGGGGASGSW